MECRVELSNVVFGLLSWRDRRRIEEESKKKGRDGVGREGRMRSNSLCEERVRKSNQARFAVPNRLVHLIYASLPILPKNKNWQSTSYISAPPLEGEGEKERERTFGWETSDRSSLTLSGSLSSSKTRFESIETIRNHLRVGHSLRSWR